jgi:hypothetical protein
VPLRFEFEAYGDRLVSREILDIGGRGLDARPAFSAIADDLFKSEERRFNSRGFGTWDDLADSTIKEKARKGLDPRVLHATLALRESLTKRDEANENQILLIEPQFLVLGTTLSYAEFHQKGKGVPMRKPLGFPVGQRRKAIKRIQKFVVTGSAAL